MPEAFVIALLGAESTGKTVLAGALAGALATPARRVAVVAEYLREFCDRHGRTPRPDEQAHIAAEQTRRINAAAQSHDIVIADTTAVMIAVYSEHVFGDTGLYASALAAHARCNLTLLTALDLPC
jgi:nicotinamide riboside kinase